MIRYLLSICQLGCLSSKLIISMSIIFSAPSYASEVSQFSTVLEAAREVGSDVEEISTNCSRQPKRLLGYLRDNILCLNEVTPAQSEMAYDKSIIAALALSRALAQVENLRKAKLTLGGLIEGMAAAAVESDIQGRESARPERQARHDRPYPLDRDRPYSADQTTVRVEIDFWVKRGLNWAKRAGACEAGAIDLLERIKRSEHANAQDRADAKAVLAALGFLRYHPEPCS